MPVNEPFIFISYKTEEREMAQRVRAYLALGTKANIWWDQDLQSGGQWTGGEKIRVKEGHFSAEAQ